ncbi:MAG: hypothetical protein ABSB99_11085 [Acidimicrobiales bacterium]
MGREGSLAYEHLRRHHRVGRKVVTQGLNFQHVIEKQLVTTGAEIVLVGVYVEATAREQEAETEVVAAHRGVMAPVEGGDEFAAECP